MANSGGTQHPYVKSFFAASMQAALKQAMQELGPDALLMNAREAPPEARHLGAYEVVFGSTPETPAGLPTPLASSAQKSLASFPLSHGGVVERGLIDAGIEQDLAREVDQAVWKKVSRRAVVEINRQGAGRTFEAASPVASLHTMQRRWEEMKGGALISETVLELENKLEIQPGLGRVAALVGPPGAGKTTTLVKLAITEGLRAGRAVHLISTDTQRIGGADQLRIYAAILGTPFQAVESTAALAQAVDAAPANALVLIDTPGYSSALLQELGSDLAAFLSRRQGIDTHLVLTASMRPPDLRNVMDLYSVFRPAKLLFTKLDEAESLASVYCAAVSRQRPLSYFAFGQVIPEDFEAATKDRVTKSLVRRLPDTLRAVA